MRRSWRIYKEGDSLMQDHEHVEFNVTKNPYREGYYYVWMRLDDTEFGVYLTKEEMEK